MCRLVCFKVRKYFIFLFTKTASNLSSFKVIFVKFPQEPLISFWFICILYFYKPFYFVVCFDFSIIQHYFTCFQYCRCLDSWKFSIFTLITTGTTVILKVLQLLQSPGKILILIYAFTFFQYFFLALRNSDISVWYYCVFSKSRPGFCGLFESQRVLLFSYSPGQVLACAYSINLYSEKVVPSESFFNRSMPIFINI